MKDTLKLMLEAEKEYPDIYDVMIKAGAYSGFAHMASHRIKTHLGGHKIASGRITDDTSKEWWSVY